VNNLVPDLRFALRTLRKNPGFAALAIVALALGIGANTAIFSVVYAVLLRPLPYQDSSRLTVLFGTDLKRQNTHDVVSHPTFLDWKNQQRSFEDLAAFGGSTFDLSGENEPEQIQAMRVSANLFPLLRAGPALGRAFASEEGNVVLLSHALWTRRFGANPAMVGKPIRLTGESYTVVGVMPAGFQFPADQPMDLWVPLVPDPSRGHGFLQVAGRLKPGIAIAQAQAEMDAIAQRLEQEYPRDQKGFGVNVVSMYNQVVGDARPALLMFLGAVGVVLLIACANVANMFLARAAARRKETSIRAALGAGRRRLMQQWLTESVLVALAGGAAGVLLAYWGADGLAAWLPSLNVPIRGLTDIRINGPVLGFTLLLSVGSGLLFGLAPAIHASGEALTEQLKAAISPRRRFTMSGFLVVSEVALSLVLLIGAGLLLKSFLLLRSVPPGFRPAQLLTFRVELPRAAFKEPSRKAEFYRQVLTSMELTPQVRSAALINTLPLGGHSNSESFQVPGRTRVEGDLRFAGFCKISPRYLRAMGIPVLAGRSFDDTDSASARQVAMVNRTLVRRAWPDHNPIGQHINILNKDREIVGVVGDVRHNDLNSEPRPEMYVPYSQEPPSGADFVVESSGDPGQAVAAARAAVWAANPDLPITGVRTVEQVLVESIAPERLNSFLVGIFAALALLLAAAGIYGVLSYSVTRQTREIGIRMALGAKSGEVMGLVLGQALRLVGAGLVIGLAGAFALTRVLAGFLYGITPTDLWTFAGVSAFLAAVALAAAYLPARRATRVDPMEALRYE
jgi:predicted permease